MAKLPRLAVVGLGNMGEALVKGLLDRKLLAPGDIAGAEKDPGRRELMAERYGIRAYPSPGEASRDVGAVLLAVKPQDVDKALGEVASALAGGETPVVSICAGITLGQLGSALPPGTPIVRAMPNTPALAGYGASVFCVNEHGRESAATIAEALLGAVGDVHRVDSEALLDAVTGLSGSGPAYVFTFLEALADGGVLMGLPRPLARALARQTVLGAAYLAEGGAEHTAELKDRVTSPGGTTSAGLRALELHGFRAAVIEAVRAATLRSKELGG